MSDAKNVDEIERHLTQMPSGGATRQVSALVLLMRDARDATGRNALTGEKIPGRSHVNWLGNLGYLVAVEQIGKSFRRKDEPEVPGNAFRSCLRNFAKDLSEDEVEALWGLRCAFAHEYGTCHIDTRNVAPEKKRHFHFVLGDGVGTKAVTPAELPWSGKFEESSFERITVIDIVRLGDLVEEIYATVVDLNSRGQLEIALPGGLKELEARYGYMIFNPSI